MKKVLLFILQVVIIFNINLTKVYANLIVNYKELNIGVNNSLQLSVSGDNLANIKWSTSDSKIATVINGRIAGVTIGSAYITVTNGKDTDVCKVNVIPNYNSVGSVLLSDSSGTIGLGETKKIDASVRPANASNKQLHYYSSDSSIATVSSDGIITGRKIGTTYITITAESKSTSYKISVVDTISLNGISVSPQQLELTEGQNSKINVSFNPGNATNKGVSFKSSNESVVTVGTDGSLKARGVGSATITVVSNDGGHVASAKVIVNALDKSLKGISLDKNEATLEVGKSLDLSVSYNPSNADNKKVTWSSSSNSIATVEEGKITAVKPGKAEIKVVSEEGKYEAICTITVLSPPIESIKFASEEQTVYLGSNTILETVSTPANTIINNPIWTSSDETVAVINEGVLTPLKVGTTIITISDEDGELTASTTVNVLEKPLDPLMITVDGYDLGFNANTQNYTLKIKTEKSLDIKVNRDSNKVIIGGNTNLKNGSIITITINDKEKITYIIEVKKTEIPIIPIIIIITILLLINIIRILKKSKKK